MIAERFWQISNYTDCYYVPLVSEASGLVQVIQGVGLIAFGNMQIHYIGLSRFMMRTNEEGIHDAANQTIEGYRSLKLGLKKTVPTLIFCSMIYYLGR